MGVLFFMEGSIYLEAVNQAFVSLEKNYDATFCGKLPKHQTNSIQPHGVLLLLDDSINTVLQVSENVPALLQLPAREVAGKAATAILSPQSVHSLRSIMREGLHEKLPLILSFSIKDNEEQVLQQLIPEFFSAAYVKQA